jgi:DNA helicase-2/ATP-dependent DNA helicase PcrA
MHIIDQLSGATDASTETSIKQIGEHAPTEEQAAIIRAVLDTDENIMIDALAGAAKTSTLEMVANQPAMMQVPTLFLAFNKKIAEEGKNRMPSNVFCATLHSIGMRTWGKAIARRTKVDFKKSFNILKGEISKERKDLADQLFESFSDINKTISWAKACGYVPDSYSKSTKRLMDDETFFMALPEQLAPFEEAIVKRALLVHIEQSFQGQIDFDDMVYCPTVFPAKFASYPLTMVDETQDLSALNHSMLRQMVNGNRLIAVGDPFQSIYGFRGAHQDSMDLLQHEFSMKRLQLSVSFRCPKAVVEEARWRAPHMRFPDWAADGEVRELEKWSVDDLPQDAVIICRNNAPLYKTAIRLLVEGRFPQIVGNDIGKSISKALDKLGKPQDYPDQLLAAIDDLELKKMSKAREHAKGGVRDFCECLRIFVRAGGDNLNDIKAYADHIINSEGPVKLMTIHKSKGLEFHNIFILDSHLCRVDKDDQEKNVLYVGQTRAQRTLTYITTEGMVLNNFEQESE